MADHPERWLTTAEAAARLHVSRQTVRRIGLPYKLRSEGTEKRSGLRLYAESVIEGYKARRDGREAPLADQVAALQVEVIKLAAANLDLRRRLDAHEHGHP